MGNAWIDAKSQYPGYLEFGLKYDLIKEGTEVLCGGFPVQLMLNSCHFRDTRNLRVFLTTVWIN